MTSMTLPSCTEAEARDLTDRIRESVVLTFAMVREAYERRVWDALFYASWEEYCNTEFKTLSLPKDKRSETIAYLRAAGMSTRAIGAAVGVSHTEVRRESGGTNVPPGPITGTDGKQYPATRMASRPASDTASTICAEFTRALHNLIGLKANVPFGSLTGDDAHQRADELRTLRNDLDQIIQLLEKETT